MSLSIARHALLIKSVLREPIWLAVTLSAALHVGAIAWMLSPDPSPREVKVAGGHVIIEVAMVEGPERHPGADTGEDRDRPSPASAPARAAPQTDRYRAADRAIERTVDQVADQVALKDETVFHEEPTPAIESVETPMAEALPGPSAIALLQPPPPPPAKPAPPILQPVARPQSRQTPPQAGAADGTDARSAPAIDGLETPATDGAHRGGTKGAAPRGDNPKPEYPFVARNRGYQGRVVLRVDVLPDGTAERVELASSSGYDSLDAAAVRTVRQWRFVPARRDGEPIAAAVTVPVLFKLY